MLGKIRMMNVNSTKQIILIRSHKCRKSDLVERFLKETELPYTVKFLDDPGVKEIVEQFGIKASPGIIVGNRSLNPYEIIKGCKIPEPEQLKTYLT